MDVRDVFLLLCSASESSGPPELWTCRLKPGASPSSRGTRLFSPASPSRPAAARPRPPAEPGWPFCSPPLTPSLCASKSSHCKPKTGITLPLDLPSVTNSLSFFWLLHWAFTHIPFHYHFFFYIFLFCDLHFANMFRTNRFCFIIACWF